MSIVHKEFVYSENSLAEMVLQLARSINISVENNDIFISCPFGLKPNPRTDTSDSYQSRFKI